MKNNVCAVLIPIYKDRFNALEEISYDRVRKILGSYDIIGICPQKLKGKLGEELRQELFEDSFFSSVDSYSRLLLSKEFYQRFVQYQYILIYQLDAFVFQDSLKYFCDLGYDYIGAPWIDGMMSKKRNKICFVGNGGLTLRRVQACINLIEDNRSIVNKFAENEDLFFSLHKGKNYRVAPVKVALSFSIESKVERCFKMNKEQLPFGCHAWEKYNIYFWKPYIEKYGYVIDENLINNGNLDIDIERGPFRRISMRLWRFITQA